MQNNLLFLITALMLSSTFINQANAFEGECFYLIWSGYPEEVAHEHMEESKPISIFAAFSGTVATNEYIRIEGKLVTRFNRLYLVPAGSDDYAKTNLDRIELRFNDEPGPPVEDVLRAGVVMVVGRISKIDQVWVIVNPSFIRTIGLKSNDCLTETMKLIE